MHRRDILLGTAAGLLLGAGGSASRAQSAWPNRPIRLIVPYPPAGGTDLISREVATRVGAATGWTIVVENRPGASGNIGIDLVAKSAPDGYTIGMGQTSNLAINPLVFESIPYQPLRDLSFISLMASQPNVLVVARDAPFRSLADVVAAARAKPDGLVMAYPGTLGQLCGELFNRRAGVSIINAAYRGAAQIVTDMLGGRVDLFFVNPLAVRGTLESGDLRVLAVTSLQRMRTLPDVPTVAESGYPGFESVNWTGLVAPAGTPAAILARLSAEARKALELPEVVARLAAEGSDPLGSTPEEFRSFLAAELEKWGRVVREAQVKVE